MAGAEDLRPPTGKRREESRTEVACRVDRVPGVETQSHTDHYYNCSHHHRDRARSGRQVQSISKRKDEQNQQRRPHHLVDEPSRKGAQVRLGIRGPNSCRTLRPGDLTYSTVEIRESFAVDDEHGSRRCERSGRLRQRIRNHFSPRKLAVNSQCDSHGRIQMRSRHTTRYEHSHSHSESPGEVDGQIPASRAAAENHLRNDTGTENDQDKRP